MTAPTSQPDTLAPVTSSTRAPVAGRKLLKSRPQTLLADPPHPTADRADPPGGGEEDEELVERRRQIDPTTCERDYTADEVEFMNAMNLYRRKNGRNFPTWSEVLEVVRSLGYHRD
jgi:hypothetical protein